MSLGLLSGPSLRHSSLAECRSPASGNLEQFGDQEATQLDAGKPLEPETPSTAGNAPVWSARERAHGRQSQGLGDQQPTRVKLRHWAVQRTLSCGLRNAWLKVRATPT